MVGRRRSIAGVAVVLLGLGAGAVALSGDGPEPAAVVRSDEVRAAASSTTTTSSGAEVVTGGAAGVELDPAPTTTSTTSTTAVPTTTTTTAPPPPPTTTTTVVAQPAPCPVEAVWVRVTTPQAEHGPGEPIEVDALFRNDSGRDCAEPYSSRFVVTDDAGNVVFSEAATAGRVEGYVYRWPPGHEHRLRFMWRPADHGEQPPPGRYVATVTVVAEDEQVRQTEYQGAVELRLTAA